MNVHEEGERLSGLHETHTVLGPLEERALLPIEGRLLSELMKNGTFYDVSLIHRLSVLNKNTSLLSITKYKAFSIVL